MKREGESQSESSKKPRLQERLDRKRQEIAAKLGQLPIQSDLTKRMEDMKSRISEKIASATTGKGLATQIHPSLLALGSTGQDTKPVSSEKVEAMNIDRPLSDQKTKEKESNEKVSQEQERKHNPYLTTNKGPRTMSRKQLKGFKFVPQGKYVEEAKKMRQQATLERLKQQIAETAIKTGLDAELELVSDIGLRKDKPPAIEWWDGPLLPNGSYTDLEKGLVVLNEDHEFVTNLIHHPAPLKKQETQKAIPLPMMLTKKERKRLKKLKRQQAAQEKQDKIRMGLLPPEQPKLRLSNLMRVLGQEAIQDPTKMEALVREQMKQRQEAAKAHDDATRLTDEQRKQKKAEKLMEDTSKGVEVAVFRVEDLTDPKIRFKVQVNAQQYNLTGVAAVYQNLNVIIVEGGPKGIKAYKKLLLRRIRWPGQEKYGHDDEEETGEEAGPETELKNTRECSLVWEGTVKTRHFKFFKIRPFPTDLKAREFLTNHRAVHYWDAAKNYSLPGSF